MTAPSSIRSVLFDPSRHATSDFDCGNTQLDRWINYFADHSRRSRTANTYVFSHDGRVIAFYALTPHVTDRDDVDRRVGRGSPDRIPSYLIAKFAVTRSHQGRGIGAALLLDALSRLVMASVDVPSRLIAVEAVDETTAHFYERHGFVRGRPSSLTLHMKTTTAIALISD